jgi:Fumarylacetoacetate (FAA) hydrolase family
MSTPSNTPSSIITEAAHLHWHRLSQKVQCLARCGRRRQRPWQATEFVGGFCLTKDMAKGNQLGHYLVTPDEVGDPYSLKVTVLVNGQVKYQGSTSEISHKAEDVFAWLAFMVPLKPGSVMGFGTIPACTGLDHDDFIDPGDEIQITLERLGTLRCRFAEPAGKLLPSRWPVHEPLKRYHG